MSCENPPGTTETTMPKRRKFDKKGICIKCKTNRGNLIVRHAVYCKACFMPQLTAKFRQILEPSINSIDSQLPIRGSLRASGNLMIGFSGGLGSTVLLHLVKSCFFSPTETSAESKGGKQHPRRNGRPWDRVIVCYVDCCQAYPGVEDRTNDVKQVLQRYEDVFDFLPLRVEDAFEFYVNNCANVDLSREDLPLATNRNSDTSSASLLKAYITSLPTATSQQSSLSSLIRLLLQYTARARSCSHLLLGTSLTSLSVNLIDAVASGAGFTLGLEKGEEWQGSDLKAVRVIRPLREVSNKECAAYLHWHALSVLGNRRMLSTPRNSEGSIGNLTKDFIFGLERDYPSTVSAIVRTCNKLVTNAVGAKCVLCERPAQPGVKDWKERIAIRNTLQTDVDSSTKTPEASGVDESSTSKDTLLTPRLCYACHTTLTSRSSRGARRLAGIGDSIHQVPLPVWVGENLHASVGNQSRREMKEQIQEYLLDSDG